jgi:hypothetical protein
MSWSSLHVGSRPRLTTSITSYTGYISSEYTIFSGIIHLSVVLLLCLRCTCARTYALPGLENT